MDQDTAARAVGAAQRKLKTARTRYNRLAQRAAHRRRIDPDVESAGQEVRAAREELRDALDAWNQTRRRPRYTAPR